MTFEAVRQASWLTPPTSGNVTVINVTTTKANVDLGNLANSHSYITVQADGANAYVLFSANSTLANNVNATATTGATSSIKIVDGTPGQPFRLTPMHRYMGVVGSGTCQVRIWQSSPPRRN